MRVLLPRFIAPVWFYLAVKVGDKAPGDVLPMWYWSGIFGWKLLCLFYFLREVSYTYAFNLPFDHQLRVLWTTKISSESVTPYNNYVPSVIFVYVFSICHFCMPIFFVLFDFWGPLISAAKGLYLRLTLITVARVVFSFVPFTFSTYVVNTLSHTGPALVLIEQPTAPHVSLKILQSFTKQRNVNILFL